jgi:hypothetical protein
LDNGRLRRRRDRRFDLNGQSWIELDFAGPSAVARLSLAVYDRDPPLEMAARSLSLKSDRKT